MLRRRTVPVRSLGFAAVIAVGLVLGGCASSLQRARSARDASDYARAEQYYRNAMATVPADRAEAQKELAALKLTQAQAVLKTDPTAAEALFEEARVLDPSDEKAIDGLGRAQAEQGKLDAAITTLGGDCNLCGRYLSVLLLERAAKREQANDMAGARADYTRAQTLVPDVTTALAIARTYSQENDHEGLFEAVKAAAELIRPEDTVSQTEFKTLREAAVMAAIKRGDVALADRWLTLFPPGAGGDGWYVLQLRIVQQLYRDGQGDQAIARTREMIGAKHADSLPTARRGEFDRFLADMYRLLGVRFLREGKIAEADDHFRQAMELSPDDNKLKLLRALAIAGMRDVNKAMEMVKALPADTKGHNEVVAILESMVVQERLGDGDLAGAKAALERAQAASSEQPEVHVALAELMFVTPVENLTKRIRADLKRFGTVKYPNDDVNRYGEALSELAWAREQAKGLGPDYLFRGPGTDARMDKLERAIRAFYPYPVEFNADATTVLRLKGSGGEVTVRGPGDFVETVRIPPGGAGEVVLTQPGLVTLRVGTRTVALFTEPYTKLTVEL